jgi:hypothetical protein
MVRTGSVKHGAIAYAELVSSIRKTPHGVAKSLEFRLDPTQAADLPGSSKTSSWRDRFGAAVKARRPHKAVNIKQEPITIVEVD